MLNYSAGIFDPDLRPQALEDLITAFGLDPEDYEDAIAQTLAVLDQFVPGDPETTSEMLETVAKYLAVLVAGQTIQIPYLVEGKQAAIANIATADATDEASAVTLANATKAKVNAILAELRAANLIAT